MLKVAGGKAVGKDDIRRREKEKENGVSRVILDR